MKRNYKAEQELWLTVRSLAWQSEPIKKRISESYYYHLIYVQPEDMPTEILKKKLAKILDRLTTKNKKIISVTDAIYYWPIKSCRSIIQDICDIYDEFIHFEWHRHP